MCRELCGGEIAIGALKLLAELDLERKVLRVEMNKIYFSQSFYCKAFLTKKKCYTILLLIPATAL